MLLVAVHFLQITLLSWPSDVDVGAVGSVTRSENFCGSLCSNHSHKGSIVGITVAYFYAVDLIHIKGDAKVVSRCPAM